MIKVSAQNVRTFLYYFKPGVRGGFKHFLSPCRMKFDVPILKKNAFVQRFMSNFVKKKKNRFKKFKFRLAFDLDNFEKGKTIFCTITAWKKKRDRTSSKKSGCHLKKNVSDRDKNDLEIRCRVERGVCTRCDRVINLLLFVFFKTHCRAVPTVEPANNVIYHDNNNT